MATKIAHSMPMAGIMQAASQTCVAVSQLLLMWTKIVSSHHMLYIKPQRGVDVVEISNIFQLWFFFKRSNTKWRSLPLRSIDLRHQMPTFQFASMIFCKVGLSVHVFYSVVGLFCSKARSSQELTRYSNKLTLFIMVTANRNEYYLIVTWVLNTMVLEL